MRMNTRTFARALRGLALACELKTLTAESTPAMNTVRTMQSLNTGLSQIQNLLRFGGYQEFDPEHLCERKFL
jgi:hypothetical protein